MALSNQDLENIKALFNQVLEDRTEDLLVTKEEIKHLPTKDEFYEEEDKVMKKLNKIDEEMDVLRGVNEKVNHNEERIENVEKKLGLHSF